MKTIQITKKTLFLFKKEIMSKQKSKSIDIITWTPTRIFYK